MQQESDGWDEGPSECYHELLHTGESMVAFAFRDTPAGKTTAGVTGLCVMHRQGPY